MEYRRPKSAGDYPPAQAGGGKEALAAGATVGAGLLNVNKLTG